MAWNYDDEEINGIIDANLKDAPPNPPAVNTAATMRNMLKSFWAAMRGQVSQAVTGIDQVEGDITEQLAAALDAVDSRAASAEAKADSVFETFQLADGLGTFNAATGIATIKETGVTFMATEVAAQPNGKYFNVVVDGSTSITGQPKDMKVGGILISRGTKWDYIPPSDLSLIRVQVIEQWIQERLRPGYAFTWDGPEGKTAMFIDDAGRFKAFEWVNESIPANALTPFSAVGKIVEKSIQEALLSDDILARLAKLLNVPGFKFVYRDENDKYPFAIDDDGKTIIAQLKPLSVEDESIPGSAMKPGSINSSALTADVSASVGKQKFLPGIQWAWGDATEKAAMWVTDEGLVIIPNLSSPTLQQQRWSGKKMLAIGDSLTAAQKYQLTVAELTGMDVTTHAKGGIGLVQMVDGDGAANDPIPALTAAQLQDKDVVTIFGTLNDRSRLVGARTDMYPAQQTIYGRLNYVIDKVFSLAASVNRKDLRIVLIAPHKVGKYSYVDADGGQEYPAGSGQTLQNIVDAIKDVGGMYGLPVIDLYRNSGINNFNWDILTLNNLSSSGPYPANPDNVHPNDAGHKLIGRIISAQLNNL